MTGLQRLTLPLRALPSLGGARRERQIPIAYTRNGETSQSLRHQV